MTDWQKAAEQAIRAERQALAEMERCIASPDFAATFHAIMSLKGKIVVTGIGKSGHVAKKIAATFHSTRQRAIFMHPAEAAHGDMGLVGVDDLILMLSNSGETDELELILDYAARWQISVIMITSRPDARLARRADVRLTIPRVPEGCPIEKVPMASAMCQMAAGDALAAALIRARGVTRRDFEDVHHGGYLSGRARSEAA